MKVKDFVRLENDDYMYDIVDATKSGWKNESNWENYPSEYFLNTIYRYQVRRDYGDYDVLGFSIVAKGRIALCIRPEEY